MNALLPLGSDGCPDLVFEELGETLCLPAAADETVLLEAVGFLFFVNGDVLIPNGDGSFVAAGEATALGDACFTFAGFLGDGGVLFEGDMSEVSGPMLVRFTPLLEMRRKVHF